MAYNPVTDQTSYFIYDAYNDPYCESWEVSKGKVATIAVESLYCFSDIKAALERQGIDTYALERIEDDFIVDVNNSPVFFLSETKLTFR